MYQFEDRFTDIELEKFKQAFVFFDRDGDGTMACDDVCLAMRAMGALATEKEVKNLLKKYDPDHTGTIDVNDFIACMAEVLHKDDSEQGVEEILVRIARFFYSTFFLLVLLLLLQLLLLLC